LINGRNSASVSPGSRSPEFAWMTMQFRGPAIRGRAA